MESLITFMMSIQEFKYPLFDAIDRKFEFIGSLIKYNVVGNYFFFQYFFY